MKHIKMSSIEQFRHITHSIDKKSAFVEMKDNEPVYDYLRPKPILKAYGTIKLHGTNGSFSADDKDIWFQSKSNILNLYKDNAGFCAFCTSRVDVLKDLIKQASKLNDISLENNIITIFGEYVGKGIQKGVGISEIEKSFFIFGCKVTPKDTEVQLANVKPGERFEFNGNQYTATEWDFRGCMKLKNIEFQNPSTRVILKKEAYWVPCYFLKSPDNRIYNIEDYKTYELEIDFNHPELANNKFLEIVKEVEEECPVAKEFGISGIGEGVVWTVIYKGTLFRFKTKGEKHSKSRVKIVKPVDLELLSKIEKCTEEITHEWRFVQALTEIFGPDYEKCIDRKRMGEYMKYVSKDTLKEEYDIIAKYNLEPKEVMPSVSKKAKEFFFAVEQLQNTKI